MNGIWERPNLISVIILVVVLAIGGAYVAFTVSQRPETESFTVDDDYFFPFNFDRLDVVSRLDHKLDEISGMSMGYKPDEIFAIQDEEGILFLVNAATGETIQTIAYGQDLDYEGVARVGDVIYVLEADGDLHYFPYSEDITEAVSQKIETRFSYRNDTEGICFDSLSNTLLIAPKEQQLNPADDNTTRRGIYSFDLQTMDMLDQPSYYVDELEIGQIVYGGNREYVFRPSGVAVDPITQDIFVLSSVGNVLVVIDRDSEIKHVELLETGTFRQPEGLTFSPAGDLYISSEESSAGNGIIATLTRMKQSDTNE
ncbi:SdiA-regulated domain-containing protein [Lewinella sp. IMCC34191]|uniref:SdiA-regulated domain-containing protein n=1 Tax=Lewinella sp. IMCC34191 TaxID=2259172 RepID=UPI000E26A56D|nr:SdiA-regulated domain-containing protein [Lewinella sp. IMCC34191]